MLYFPQSEAGIWTGVAAIKAANAKVSHLMEIIVA
jgi:hypothetical protein